MSVNSTLGKEHDPPESAGKEALWEPTALLEAYRTSGSTLGKKPTAQQGETSHTHRGHTGH